MPGDTMAIYGIRQEHMRICSLYFKAHIQIQQRSHSQCACTMQVLEFSPMKESLRTLVKVLIRKGMWSLFLPSERMHSYGTHERRHAGMLSIFRF